MSIVEKVCSVANCDRPVRLAGMCGAHHQRKLRGQPLEPPLRENPALKPWPECSIEYCPNTADSKLSDSVCATHRTRYNLRGTYDTTRISDGTIPICTIRGCNEPYRAAGLCNSHHVKSKTYNLGAMQLDMLYGDGTCNSCGLVPEKSLHIDHDHSCCAGSRSCGNCVRGVLCGKCNVGLGCFTDSPEKLQAAITYLERGILDR